MQQKHGLLVGFLVVTLTTITTLPAKGQAGLTVAQFQQQVSNQLKTLASQTTAAVYVQELGSSTPVFSNDGDTLMVPASTSKLMTTGAAFEKLGGGFTFTTNLILQGGQLIVQGSGDPNLVGGDLQSMANQVAAAGIKSIASIAVNNSLWSADYTGLEQFAGYDSEIDAPVVSASSLNQNIVEIEVIPTASGKPSFFVLPYNNNYAIIQSQVEQVAGTANNLTIKSLGMQGNQEVFQIGGTIGGSGGTQIAYAACANAESNFAYSLAGLLRQAGVTVTQDFDGVSFSPLPTGGQVVASHVSDSLTQIAGIYMPDSINFMAEQVFQTYGAVVLGGQASLAKSESAIQTYMNNDPSCSSSVMVNGSGLTWSNQISTHCFIDSLQSLSERSPTAFSDLISSLPIGGTGTLAGRFGGAPSGFVASHVHAKTGTLWSEKATSALIGLTTLPSGKTVLFAMIENDSRPEESLIPSFHTFEDSVVELVQQLSL